MYTPVRSNCVRPLWVDYAGGRANTVRPCNLLPLNGKPEEVNAYIPSHIAITAKYSLIYMDIAIDTLGQGAAMQ